MIQFKNIAIGNLVDIRRGASPRPIDEWMAPTGIPWIKISDATEDSSRYIKKTKEYIKTEGACHSVKVCPGDLIISNSATPGLPKIVTIDACIHDGWLKVENYHGVDKDYLFYAIKHFSKYLVQKGNGSIFINLKTEILKNFAIPIPVDDDGNVSIALQKKIVSSLVYLDELIDNNKSIINRYNEIIKEIFNYWFVQFDFPNEEGKPYKSTGGEMIYDNNLALNIPSGWKSSILGETLKIFNGKDHKALLDGDYPVYGSGGLMRKVNDFLYDGEAVLIPRKGTLNNVMYVNEAFWTVDTMYYCKALIPFSTVYQYHWLKKFDFESFNTGSAVPSMTMGIIYNLKIVIPPDKIMKQFDDLAQPLLKQCRIVKKETEKLQKLRDFLLPLLMNGQVSFKEA